MQEDDRQKDTHCNKYVARIERLLKQVNDCLENGLVDCPPPGHPDRRESRKVYFRPEAAGEPDSEDEELDDADGEYETVEEDQSVGLAGDHTRQIGQTI